MKRYAKIFVSCLLTFTMVFTSVQWSAIVHETTVVGAAETVPKEKKEVVEEENTKDSTTFQMKDGKKQTVFYGQDVRFKDENGDLQEYDPSLVRVTESKSEQGEDLKDYQFVSPEGFFFNYLKFFFFIFLFFFFFFLLFFFFFFFFSFPFFFILY